MATQTLVFASPQSLTVLAVAWVILLKDYVASNEVAFSASVRTTRSGWGIPRVIDVTLGEKDSVSNLKEKLEEQLSADGPDIASTRTQRHGVSWHSHLLIDLVVEGTHGRYDQIFPGKLCKDDVGLSCKLRSDGREVEFTIILATNAGSPKRVERMLKQYVHVIGQLQGPKSGLQSVRSIECASPDDLRDIGEWNRHIPVMEKRSALDIFRDHVQRQPDDLALDTWEGNMTYGELDLLSTRLSHQLHQRNLGRGDIVPLCFEKSIWTIVAIVAVVKAGAAFALLDERVPEERLRQFATVIASDARLVLTSSEQQERAKVLGFVVVVVDSTLYSVEAGPKAKPICINPGDPIYIVFTSGTTGTPKAARITHSNISSFAASVGSVSKVNRGSRILALASYAYDVSLGNIFLSLLRGACLCIPSSWECANAVGSLVAQYAATHLQTTPSVCRLLEPTESQTLEVLDLCGEPCTEDILSKWRGGRTRVMNTYSPAECTVTSVIHPNILEAPKPSIIGKGLGACWIVDPRNGVRLTPIGGIGELVLEGPLVGLGYLHDEKATKSAFMEAPEWLLTGLSGVFPPRNSYLYRTGDLVRFMDDGLVEYIGRRDRQVKIRGQRVELSEIFAHLQKLIPPQLQWCPEVARLKTGRELLLIFLVPGDEHRANIRNIIDQINAQLQRKLPPAMVPGGYLCIDHIPLTLTGKTDHAALREIAAGTSPSQLLIPRAGINALRNEKLATDRYEMYQPNGEPTSGIPHGANSTKGYHDDRESSDGHEVVDPLRIIWGQVLNVDPTAIHDHDSFFGHGGESLSAIALVDAAARKGLHLDVATIFRYPQLSDMASRCKRCSTDPQGPPLRFSLLLRVVSDIARRCATTVENIEDIYPCTPMQEGLIAADYQRAATYVGRTVLDLPNDIDPRRLANAWERVVATHSILRTRIFHTESHGLLQVVLREGHADFEVKMQENLSEYLKNDRFLTMGLGTALCRWAIVRDASHSRHFVLTMHHAIYDGWTLPRLGKELFRALKGIPPHPAVGFNIFIQYLLNQPQAEAHEYWSRKLADHGTTAFFPAVRESHLSNKMQADTVTVKSGPIPHNATSGVSMASLLRAAWAALVGRLSGSDDVTFGATVTGRNVPIAGIQHCLAPTISTIPIRVQMNEEETVEQFVRRVQEESVEAIPFEYIGLQAIRRISPETRQGSQFRTLLIIHPPDSDVSNDVHFPLTSGERRLKDMLEKLAFDTPLSNFNEYALLIMITPHKGSLRIEASYDSRILDPDDASRLLDQFLYTAVQLGSADNLSRNLAGLSLVPAKDLERIWQWNATPSSARQAFIHDIIANTIARQPSAPAICAWDGDLTFDEVDRESIRLSYTLKQRGVGHGSLVPICMEKSKWAAIAMLAVLRARAAFIMMDVRRQPRKRLEQIAKEVNATCILAMVSTTSIAMHLAKTVILCDGSTEVRDRCTESMDIAPPAMTPSSPAFVVFTSGSTGTPKGIVITHQNFATTVSEHAQMLRISTATRVYDYASYSFDIAVHNALMSLCLGACLCVPSEEDRLNDIEGSVRRLQANWANFTPSVARLLTPSAMPILETVVLSGEAVGRDVLEQWRDVGLHLINAYGPAECQICTVQTDLQHMPDAATIGRGVACATWVVDPKTLQLAPLGSVGELIVEGPIVSPGYLNVQSDNFIDSPDWLKQGSHELAGRTGRLYRTGDLVRYLPDGRLVYVGRATTQVKLNGQRVELDEVAFHVRRCLPTVYDAVADIVAIGGIDHLCVFLRYDSGGSIRQDADLRVELAVAPPGLDNMLKDYLASISAPVVYFTVPYFPLTHTMKLNRRTLRKLAAGFSRGDILRIRGHGNAPPMHNEPVEQQAALKVAWGKVLKLPPSQIQSSSDFFELGGDSISAMRLVKLARRKGFFITVTDILRHSTLQDLMLVLASRQISDVNTYENYEDDFSVGKGTPLSPFTLLPVDERDRQIAAAAVACNVRSADIVDMYPCTPFQEGVFAETVGNASAYVQRLELRISRTHDLDHVLCVWGAVIADTPILRTRIIQSEGGPLIQVVLRDTTHTWPRYDNIEQYMLAEETAQMAPGRPLSKFALIVPAAAPTSSIVWTVHHALYDSWTMNLILQDVSSRYKGLQPNTPPIPQYSLFVQFLKAQEASSKLWWEKSLSGASDAAVYPKASLSTTGQRSWSKTQYVSPFPSHLPPGYTIATLLRSAWAILMARQTSGESILFGEVRIGRHIPLPNIESIRGPTIAAVPVLIQIGRDDSVTTFLQRMRDNSIEMQAFEHLGLQNIARLSRDARAACKFQTCVVFQEHSTWDATEQGGIFEFDDSIDDVRNFNSWNLLVVFTRRGGELMAEAVFGESALPRATVNMLLRQALSIFHGLCTMADMDTTTIHELDRATSDDLQLISQWNSDVPDTVDSMLHDIVAQHANVRPDQLAVDAHDGQLTYGQLEDYSSQLAAQLASVGIGIDTFVPLCFEKSVWVPVAMLAVTKAGAAFSVLDVAYPESRLQAIVDCLGSRLILASPSQRQLAERLSEDVIVVDNSLFDAFNSSRTKVPDILRDPGRIMYVCFTSGSTGVPKGVMVSHRNLASAAVAQTQGLNFIRDDRIYDFSSHAFDANIWHFWLGFVIGACVCIPSEEERKSDLAGSIYRFQTTALFLTPSVARTLDPNDIPSVQRLYLGGEAVTPLDVAMWAGQLDLWGAYGPTETTPLSIFTRLQKPESASNIGRGFGVIPWVCNPQNHHELVSIGAVGEMVLEGPLVTLGYLGLPEKSATVFIRDPEFLKLVGRCGRVYKTGDLVRYAADGSIEYLGRADTQIKLRGQRVEFGEIEYHLRNSLLGALSICDVVSNSVGQPTLVAFCVVTSPLTMPEPDYSATRSYLSQRLPPYMIPAAFFTVPEIPKIASGKVDRLRLRAMGRELLEQQSGRNQDSERLLPEHGPMTERESEIHKLWLTALGHANIAVSINTDFFELGADSITAMKLSTMARKQGLLLAVRDIIDNSTLSGMSMKAETLRRDIESPSPFSLIGGRCSPDSLIATAAATCRVSPNRIEDIYPCTPLQVELVALGMKQPGTYMNRSVFEVPSNIDFQRLCRAWDQIIALNPILRTRFVVLEGHGLMQVVVKGHEWNTAETLQDYLVSNVPSTDLGSPLARVAAITEGQDRQSIVWTIHHALYDAWSIHLIEEQLIQAYNDGPIVEPPRFSGYVRYTLSTKEEDAAKFWQTRLTGCASSVVSYPALPSNGFQARPSATFRRMLRPIVTQGGNVQAVIHTAWALIISELTETNDVVFGATLAGRDGQIPGIEQMVGPTIAPVPIRVRLGGPDQLVQDLIKITASETAATVAYQHIGTRNIAGLDDDTQAACQFQTLLVVTPEFDVNLRNGDTPRLATYDDRSNQPAAFHTFPLLLFFNPHLTGLGLEIIFDPRLLNSRMVERLAGRLDNVLTAIARQDRRQQLRMEDVPSLGPEDMEDINAWNAVVPPSSNQLLHELILDRARISHPSEIAIDAWDRQITYSQLDTFSNIVAVQLRQYKVAPGSVVPILSPKSGIVPVAMLGVLRTGAAFLPLDPMQPVHRLNSILTQVNPSIILAAESCSGLVQDARGITILPIERTLSETDIDPDAFTSQVVNEDSIEPGDSACILFTSGTTGAPKGVIQSHRALSSAVKYQSTESGFEHGTRAFEFASYMFDVSWNMIFKVLATGGTLCVPHDEERQNDLVGALNRSRATLTELTATVARLVDPSRVATLKTLILSGEFVDLRDFVQWSAAGVQVIVCYGPSECTSVSTINGSAHPNNGIGRGLGCVTWLVHPDNRNQLVPVGAVGEVVIQGPIVGKGYFADKAGTFASYPPLSSLHWGQGRGNGHVFLTGDLAQYDDQGNLHFVGRKDTQIKINGQRLELEEVEHHIHEIFGNILQGPIICCAWSVSQGQQKMILAAFLCCEVEGPVSLINPPAEILEVLHSIESRLQDSLPRVMIPSVFYAISGIPRTSNGKIDRRKLIELSSIAGPAAGYRGQQGEDNSHKQQAPVTLEEKEMQQLWAAALQVSSDSIGREHHFFHTLQGDSISAMKLVARARDRGYAKLRVSDVFTYPRLMDLALKIKNKPEGHEHIVVDEIKPFCLLSGEVDVATLREEVAAQCQLADPHMVEDVYPCTPLQEGMLAGTIRDPNSFTSMRLYRVLPKVVPERLKSAWALVVARNRTLRTRLVHTQLHGLVQAIIQDVFVWDRYPNIESFLQDGWSRPMGLGVPLTRWAWIDGPDGPRLVWIIHHATYDGWILRLIEDELQKAYYGQYLSLPHPDLRPLVRYLRQMDHQTSINYWRHELQHVDEPVIFPTLQPERHEPQPNAFIEHVISSGDLSSSSMSLSTLLYAGWAFLVSRLTGSQRVAFGTIRTGRAAPVDGIDRLVGPTITTVPIVVDVDPSLSVGGFMEQIQDYTVRMIPHEHLGVSAIRRISPTAAKACSFQTVLVIQPPGPDQSTTGSPDLLEEIDETQIEGFPDQHAVLNQYGLMLEIIPRGDTMRVRASFDVALITHVQMERTIHHLETLITCLLEEHRRNSSTELARFRPLSKHDLTTIWDWNHEAPQAVMDRFVHQTVSELALLQPDSPAIDAWDGQFTYSELEFFSSRLARRLVLSGIGPGSLVPLIFEKSRWANISMLGVLKAGAAFVPLDSHQAEGHLRGIMQCVGGDLILCSAHTRDRAIRLAAVATIVDEALLREEETMEARTLLVSAINTRRALQPGDLAYAVFTSGSTGSAKGVRITHANLATAVHYQAGPNGYQIGPESRTLDSSFYSFDACVCNFFYTITQGGCLCVPAGDSLNGDLGAYIQQANVNWAQLVPSVARTLAPDRLPQLKHLILTGEAIRPGDVQTWSSRLRLINAYGPTECTILCAMSSPLTITTALGNIGQGHGARLWITEIGNPDSLAPVGAIGEVLIEGPIVGAGYLGLDEFPLVTDPSWLLAGSPTHPGRHGILFRTGDQAQYSDDGSLILLGRIGSQVKLRGQRVDLAGVEDVVQHSLAPGDMVTADIACLEDNRQMLLTFVVTPDEDRLRELTPMLHQALEASLPYYMHPEAIVLLPSMPRTNSGKTDRRQLREIGASLRRSQLIWLRSTGTPRTAYMPPVTDNEAILASVWAVVLNIPAESIGRHDDFFLLGGDSLSVMRLTTQLHARGYSLRTRHVFEMPMLSQLATHLVSLNSPNDADSASPYSPFSLVPEVNGSDQFIMGHLPDLAISADQIEDILPANGFQVDYILNQDEPFGLQYAYLDIGPQTSWPHLISAVRTVVQYFDCLRSRFVHHAGKYYQLILRDAPLVVEECHTPDQISAFSRDFCPRDCRQAHVSDIYTKITLVHSSHPSNHPQLTRRVILRLSHMQNDGWCSIHILNAIAAAYNGQAIPPAPSWTSLLAYRNARAEQSQAYWRTFLSQSRGPTPPLCHRPVANSSESNIYQRPVRTLRTIALSNFHSAKHNRHSRPAVVMNTAWALVLHHLSGHEDLVFGNVTTGRHGAMPGLAAVIGPCVNMLPTRLQVRTSSRNRQEFLRALLHASADQVDSRTPFEGLDWEDLVAQCTTWPPAARYSSAVHFRNMAFEPILEFGADALTVSWYELVARPQWTTLLVYPEEQVLRVWLIANPAEIGDAGADEILGLLAGFVEEVVAVIRDL
ncbi:nonribosomal peptide synthase [Aspergillus niger]|nr:nonribosomal peptide synthase [Aspergillus niger]